MAIKNLKGIAKNIPDNTVDDISCQEIYNLRFRDGGWRPVGNKKEYMSAFPYPTESTYIHTTDDAKTLIYYDPTHSAPRGSRPGHPSDPTIRTGWLLFIPLSDNMSVLPTPIPVWHVGEGKTFRFASLGNVVTVYNDTDHTMTWMIWDVDIQMYEYIDGLPDMPEVEFKAQKGFVIDIGSVAQDNNPYLSGRLEELDYVVPDGAGYDARKEALNLQISGYLAKKRAEESEAFKTDGYVFLQAAYELFDGSYIKHSSPVCLNCGSDNIMPFPSRAISEYPITYPSTNPSEWTPYPLHVRTETGDYNRLTIVNRAIGQIFFRIRGVIGNAETYNKVVKSVCVFSSVPIHYKVEIDDINLCYMIAHGKAELPSERVSDLSAMFKVAEVELNNVSVDDWVAVEKDFSKLTTFPSLTVNDFSHHRLWAQQHITYNGRIFNGYTGTKMYKGHALLKPSTTSNQYPCAIATFIKTTAGNRVVYSDTGAMNVIGGYYYGLLPQTLSYPDSRAYKMRLFRTDTLAVIAEFELKAHPFRNIAYFSKVYEYLDPVAVEAWAGGILQGHPKVIEVREMKFLNANGRLPVKITPASLGTIEAESNDILIDANRVQATEINNPFYFPSVNSYQVGTTSILGFATNSLPVSEGQFGHYPLFAFTDSGMYAMTIGVDPLIPSIVPLNGLVPSSKAMSVDRAVAFPSTLGLILMQGAKTTNISSVLNRADPNRLLESASFTKIRSFTGFSMPTFPVTDASFLDYLEGAVMGYCEQFSEILISNSSYPYTWVFGLASEQWYKITESYERFLYDYPRCYGVRGGKLYSMDEVSANKAFFIQSRPIKIETGKFVRTDRAIMRGLFDAVFCGSYLFGSIDGLAWGVLSSQETQGEARDMIHLRHNVSVKYLTLVMTGVLKKDSYVTHLEYHYEEDFNNKDR